MIEEQGDVLACRLMRSFGVCETTSIKSATPFPDSATSSGQKGTNSPFRLTSSSVEVMYSPNARTTSSSPTEPCWTAG